MGIDWWIARDAAPAVIDVPVSRASAAAHPGAVETDDPEPGPAVRGEPAASVMDSPGEAARPRVSQTTAVAGPAVAQLSWDALSQTVTRCQACELHQGRTQAVFGVGDRAARLMIIGEAPGADEDRQGEPFVGRAGQLLDRMLDAIGLRREQVYIANIVKCRPPGNRDPHGAEAAACQAYLHRQIALLEPALILAVGRVSAHQLLGTDLAVGRLRGRVHRFQLGDIPLVVTYHPAYLLRRPQEKAKAWQDLQRVSHSLGVAPQ